MAKRSKIKSFKVKVKGVKKPRIIQARSESHLRNAFTYLEFESVVEIKRLWLFGISKLAY